MSILKKATVVLRIISVVLNIVLYYYNRALNTKVSDALINEKVYMLKQDSLRTKNRVLKYNIEQLTYYKDSIINEFINIKDSLNGTVTADSAYISPNSLYREYKANGGLKTKKEFNESLFNLIG